MLQQVAIFTAIWYYTSSKNAVATQHLVQQIMPNIEDNFSKGQIMSVLTTLQLLAGICVALPIYFILLKNNTKTTEIRTFTLGKKPFIYIGIFHSLGSFFTNLGFAFGSASLVQIIKLLEPIETLLLTVIFAQSFSAVTARKSISMMVTITGTSILLLPKRKDSRVNTFSIAFALLSGLSLSFRNVTVKHFQKEKGEHSALNGIRKFIEISSAGAMISCLHSILIIKDIPRFTKMIINCDFYGFQAIIFHGLYNLASISVLSFISAPSHSLLNVGKRISNVIVATIAFKETISMGGVVGLIMAFIGGITYSMDPRKIPISKISVVVVASLLLMVSQYLYSTATLRELILEPTVMLEKPPLVQVSPARERKIVLLGPHDRYNFGDLLFTKTLKNLLVTRAGYNESDILFGGVVPTNMTMYGGEEIIHSMKQIQQMSVEDDVKGPYDIIYTGGEAVGCSHGCAVGMMPNEEMRQIAMAEKIYDCGYLVPKSYLVPDSEKDNPSNFAIINSMGGNTIPECKEAVLTADFGSYRDPDKFPSYPDSAVMIKELYGKEIDMMADEVMNEIFSVTDGTTTQSNGTKYIAVQHKISGLNIAAVAKSLDVVSKESGATIVFFAAGTVNWHDSFEKYEEIAALMEQPSIVYKAENVWKVVALISRSEALISTSLHCRIMAFIFFRPRVTWCSEGKHRNFINRWDSKDSPPCVSITSEVWPILKDYYGSNPKITQEMTKEMYEAVIKKYLRVFDSWSAILRKKY